MKGFLLVLLAASPWSIDLAIPVQYQKDKTVVVHFIDPKLVDETCGGHPAGGITMACVDKDFKELNMPNPCKDKDVKDKNSYSHLLCHELAHTEGWRHG